MRTDISRDQWSEDDVGNVGRLVFERIPECERADWAASIALFAGQYAPRQEIDRLVELSLSSYRWHEAKDIFDQMRRLTLENERKGGSRSLDQLVLDIAETAAKVIANAGGAKFDHHAGWRMAPRLRALSNQVADRQFENEAWQLLLRERAA